MKFSKYHIFDGDCYQGVEYSAEDVVRVLMDPDELARCQAEALRNIVKSFINERHDNTTVFRVADDFVVEYPGELEVSDFFDDEGEGDLKLGVETII